LRNLRPGDALGGDLDVGIGGDDRRALATELERDRREVFRGRPHDDAADLAVAGVEDVVEALLQQRRGLVDRPGDHRDVSRSKYMRDEFLDERRRPSGVTSDGFSTAVLPAASAGTSGANSNWTG
jgi:hypothetical protein